MKKQSNNGLLKILTTGFLAIILGVILAGIDKRDMTYQRMAALENKIETMSTTFAKK